MKPRALGLLAALAAAACQAGSPSAGAGTSPGSRIDGTVTVFAAASLTNVFTNLAGGFEKANPGVKVALNFAGSPTLVTQLTQGARADVLATADTTNMHNAQAAGLLQGGPSVFAHNLLEIAVAPGNPKRIESLSDLARADVTLVLAAPQVPAGRYATQVLSTQGVQAHPRSLETDVESVLTKVELGEADAGIVYATDVKAAGGKVLGVAIPAAQNVVASYPVAALKGAPNAAAGGAFIRYLLSGAGTEVLRRYGFQTGSSV